MPDSRVNETQNASTGNEARSLRESESRYRAIVDAFEGFIYICSKDFRIEFMNRQLIDRTGRDATGELCYEVLHELGSVCPWCVNDRVFQGEKVAWEIQSPKDDRWYHIVNTPIRREDGTVSKLAMIQDVTERKRAAELMVQSHEIVSRSPVVVFLWKNAEGWPVEYVTENVERIFGHTSHDFMSGKIAYSDVVHPDDLDRVSGEVVRFSQEEGHEEFTHEPYRISARNGDTVWVEDRTLIRRDETGTITHYEGVLEDITERKLAQDALEQGENFLEDVINSIQDGISVLDRDLNILLINRTMTEWYAHRSPLEGKKCFFCYHDRQEPCDPCPTLRALQSGVAEVDIVPGPADSTVEWIELFSFPIRDRQRGEITGVVEFVRDITEKTRLERQLLHAQKMESIGTLAGGLAHDFNNLLMAIQGYASLMGLDIEGDHPHHECLQGIESSVRSASDLTKQLMGLARGGKYEVLPTSMNQILGEMTEMFGRTKKEIEIARRLLPDLWTVEVDRRQFETVLLNLLINAWQAMPDGGEITVQTENVVLDEGYVQSYGIAPGRYVKVAVTDTGHGMDEQTRERVFDPFFTTKERGKGTGLGLASVYGIVKNHGGLINVDSEVGMGTTITIYLPASDRECAASRPHLRQMHGGSETILIVDDEKMILNVAKKMLEKLGYAVVAALGGRQAVETFRTEHERIDLVILDMVMPGMNGSETFDRLKRIDPRTRVLLSSGYSINGQAREILDRGCVGFIQKPFNINELSDRLREVLGVHPE